MNTSVAGDLRAFHQFIGEKLGSGHASLSPEEVLDEWQALHEASGTELMLDPSEIAAIEAALQSQQSGDRGVLLSDFDREFRLRHKLPLEA